MSDNLIDLSLYIFTQAWFWAAVFTLVLAIVLIAVWGMDDNDRKLERMERERSERLRDRLADDGDPESILTRVYDEPDQTDFWQKLLHYYQFSARKEGSEMVLTDRKHFELRNREYRLPLDVLQGADEQATRRVLSQARYNVNRRAKAHAQAKGVKAA